MSARSTAVAAELSRYAVEHSTAPDATQSRLIEATADLGGVAGMQIGPDQGALLTILAGVLRPRFAVEVGTFTGYSALAVARALPPGGRLLCCDVSEEWTAIARQHWAAAGVDDRIDLRIGPALATLQSLPAEPAVDLAFIDADKTGYIDYYEELVPRLAPTGLLAVDNTLWGGQVVAADDDSDDTVAVRAFNDHAVADKRTEVALLTVGDGVSLIRRVT